MEYGLTSYVGHVARVEVEDQVAKKRHFTLCVLEDDHGVVGGTAEEVWCPDHGEVVVVHLGQCVVLRPAYRLRVW